MASMVIELGDQYNIKACGSGAKRVQYNEVVDGGQSWLLKGQLKYGSTWIDWTTIEPKSNIQNITATEFEIVNVAAFPFPCIAEI